MYKVLIIVVLILSCTSANADYFRDIKCAQNVSEVDGLILDATKGANFEKKEYRKKNDLIQIGESKIEFHQLFILEQQVFRNCYRYI